MTVESGHAPVILRAKDFTDDKGPLRMIEAMSVLWERKIGRCDEDYHVELMKLCYRREGSESGGDEGA
jgi:hypothetical protein